MTTWGTIERHDWTYLISFSNIGPYMIPPVETNFDVVVQDNVTPSVQVTYNLGQKDMRYLNVGSDVVACSNIGFHQGGDLFGSFSGSYNELRDKPTGGVGTPEYYEALPFFPDKTLTLTAQSNNLISGLALEASGAKLSYFRVDRLVCNEMSLLNGPIENVAYPELPHHATTKGYVDQSFLAYTPTKLIDFRFEAVYAKKFNF